MAQRGDSVDLGTLRLSPGEARSLTFEVRIDDLSFGGQIYSAGGEAAVRLDVSRTMSGYALRVRFDADLSGPCMRCLEGASARVEVDSREIDQPDDAEELRSPYVEESTLDLRGWARDALALALPTQISCRAECLGLCARCGENLNASPDHVQDTGSPTPAGSSSPS